LPVDEEHPLRPQDPYGLTKLAGEDLCSALAAKSGVPILSLRFSGIYTEEHRTMFAKRKSDPLIRGTGSLWSYIDARDAAGACRLALDAQLDGHQAFNIAAATNLVNRPIDELAVRYLSDVKELRAGLSGNGSGYSVAKAKSVLGFEAKISLVD
jgi:nucleoside-diphosphate-sugar epimerase